MVTYRRLILGNWGKFPPTYTALTTVITTHLLVVVLVGATSTKKPNQNSKSNRIEMKFDRNVLQVNTHRLKWSGFYLMSKFQDGGRDFISRRKVQCCHLVSETEASDTRICSSARQFLICSTFIHVRVHKRLHIWWSFIVIRSCQ